MKTDILATLEHSRNLIISPDMDGFMSAKLLERFNGSQIVGSYDKNILCLADRINPEDCLFLDCDMNRYNFVSLGNHMRLLEDSMSYKSFNPNVHFGVTTYSDKFPFATAFLISFATEVQTSTTDLIRMAFADSTLRNMEKYSNNMRNWSDRMDHPAVRYIMDNSDIAKQNDAEARFEYVDQSFTSKRYGKERYLDTLNKALEAQGMKFKPLTRGSKYLCDKVGLNTLKRYNKDIISYAEIFTGEYSVTYDELAPWN
ncbi:MAG: hypothetical protein ACK5P0_00350 [bacterium]|jgi:hypothetical protein